VINGAYEMAITMNWGALGLGSVVAFVIGWLIFGLLGAVVLAVIVLVLMGILKFR
jgi:phage-related minor tail protein